MLTLGTITGVLIALQILILRLMGRIWMCACGFGLWTGSAWSSETSQHLADPYSASHLLHGIIFFWALSFFRRLSTGTRLVIALVVEIGWEILENSPLIIDRYRAATASLDYFGDSILNSVGDVLFMLLGFWLTMGLPWKWTLAVVIIIEILMLIMFRDNLTLNVLMLLYPVAGIREWQALHG